MVVDSRTGNLKCRCHFIEGMFRPLRKHLRKQSKSSTECDCGVCIWPWQGFVQLKADCPLIVTSNLCITFENTLARSSILFGACETIQIFPMLFCVVIAVHQYDFRLVINETTYKRRPAARWPCSDRDSCFLHDLCVFPDSSCQY
jgi:hypothetical protein